MPVEYLARFQPYDPAIAATADLWYSVTGHTTRAADTPSRQYCAPRMIQPFQFARSLFKEAATAGGSAPGTGTVVLNNGDGGLDALESYSWGRREFKLYKGTRGDALSAFTAVFTGVSTDISFDDRTVTIAIADNQYRLRRLLQENLLANTASAAGVPKPIAWGIATTFAPPLAAGGLVHQLHDGDLTGLSAGVFDGGVALASPADYTIDAAAGQFTLASLRARLLSSSLNDAANSSAKNIIQNRFAAKAGLAYPGDFDTASWAAFAPAGKIGIVFQAPILAEAALDELCRTDGAFYYYDAAGKLVFGIFAAPSGAAAASYAKADISRIERVKTEPPAWRVRCSYSINLAVHADTDLATSVGGAGRATWTNERLYRAATDSGVKTTWADARELTIDGWENVAAANADTEAARLLNIYKVKRDVFRVTLPGTIFARSLHDVVTIKLPRYGLVAGKDFRVIGMAEDAAAGSTELTLWG